MSEREFEEAIREKILDDLHGPVFSKLRGLRFRARMVVQSPDSSPDSMRVVLAEMDKHLRDAVYEIRRIVLPSLFGMSGEERISRFLSHLKKDVHTLKAQFGMEIKLNCSPMEFDLLSSQQFLIIQDILYNWLDNIGRHAKARNVIIDLHINDVRSPSSFTLTVTNDGQGTEELNDIERFISKLPRAHRGLRRINAQAENLGSRLQVYSSLIGGTTLTIKDFPVLSKSGS